MKIFLFTKKILYIHISFIVGISLVIFLFFYFSRSFATDLASPNNISNEFLHTITHLTNQKEKIAYLTFDDGPTTSVTPKILDILKEEKVKASFFVIGKSVELHPEIVKRAYEEGHYIANHGYSHNNAILYQSPKHFIKEVTDTDLAIEKAIGVSNYCSHIFRFPNGFITPLYKTEKKEAAQLLANMNYAYLDWNCLNHDSVQKYTTNQLLNNLKHSSKGKDTLVILMHDTKDVNDSSLVLKDSICYLREQGYEFQNFYSLLSTNK